MENAIQNLTLDISKFDFVGENDCLMECDDLLEKYGQLPVLLELKTLLQTRHNVSTTINRLKKLQTIDAKLDMSLSLTELKNIYEEINSLNEKRQFTRKV